MRWLLPLIQQHGPWLTPAAFARPAAAPPAAPPAAPALPTPPALPTYNASTLTGGLGDATEIDPDALSIGSLLSLAAAAASLATIVVVCVCSGPVGSIKGVFRRRRREALTAIGKLKRHSEGAKAHVQVRLHLLLTLTLALRPNLAP